MAEGQAIVMETLRSFPNLPAMVRRQQSWRAPHAIALLTAGSNPADSTIVMGGGGWGPHPSPPKPSRALATAGKAGLRQCDRTAL